ncbi:MAG TPA: hypothetical protein VGV07_15185 [Devosia sp.]|jgi:hypothetical protein|uniref:hypothetical protein n=1 Tax=Devosia sp. TaxID=1871048 RepID=UPI002DDC9E91|nr:hypothetical protein [Devosia sp.]HEV2516599.1 hypothetical protein [Devosia sp.]
MSGANWVVLLLAGIGLMLTNAAIGSWTTGDPPPASVFGQRSAARVVEARVVSATQNGSLRHVPLVLVQWDGQVTELRGLTGSFYDYRNGTAETAIRGIVIGQAVAVRVVEGALYVDRTDWLRLGGAIWLSLFALIAWGAGVVLSLPGRFKRLGRPRS